MQQAKSSKSSGGRAGQGGAFRAPEATGILIAGGGYVGLSAALAIKRSAPALAVTIVDATPPETIGRDGRASAIAGAARRMLEQLGVWADIAAEAQPITEMTITDSRTADHVRPVFLTFAGEVGPGEAFAHMVPNARLVAALRDAAQSAGVRSIAPETVRSFEVRTSAVDAKLGSGELIGANLLIAADGGRSRLRGLAGIRTLTLDYGQSGIVATVEHERPHGGRAEEHFLPDGPFAVLPLQGNRSSLVWTERTETAERLVAADASTFQAALDRRFGRRLGIVRPVGRARAHPLSLTLARAFVGPRFALAGDAAHGIHPIAGQGLNLGFKDAAALAESIVEASRLGLDIGGVEVLRRYERWRRFDTLRMGIVTDILNRLFSNDVGPVRFVRDIGLGLVDRMPRLKERFIREAAGMMGDDREPRLLRGEPV